MNETYYFETNEGDRIYLKKETKIIDDMTFKELFDGFFEFQKDKVKIATN